MQLQVIRMLLVWFCGTRVNGSVLSTWLRVQPVVFCVLEKYESFIHPRPPETIKKVYFSAHNVLEWKPINLEAPKHRSLLKQTILMLETTSEHLFPASKTCFAASTLNAQCSMLNTQHSLLVLTSLRSHWNIWHGHSQESGCPCPSRTGWCLKPAGLIRKYDMSPKALIDL